MVAAPTAAAARPKHVSWIEVRRFMSASVDCDLLQRARRAGRSDARRGPLIGREAGFHVIPKGVARQQLAPNPTCRVYRARLAVSEPGSIFGPGTRKYTRSCKTPALELIERERLISCEDSERFFHAPFHHSLVPLISRSYAFQSGEHLAAGIAYDVRNASRSSLSWFLCVSARPWGAPL
jgi:hypothetical protein